MNYNFVQAVHSEHDENFLQNKMCNAIFLVVLIQFFRRRCHHQRHQHIKSGFQLFLDSLVHRFNSTQTLYLYIVQYSKQQEYIFLCICILNQLKCSARVCCSKFYVIRLILNGCWAKKSECTFHAPPRIVIVSYIYITLFSIIQFGAVV